MIFIAIRILLLNSPISPKKKKRKKKGEKESFERIFQTSTNFQFLEQLNESLIHNHSETFQIVFESISRHVCGVSFSKASIRSNFLETKIYNFLHTPRKGAPPKSYPLSRSVVAPFALFTLLPFVLFRSVIAIYALAHPFLFVSHCLSTNTDFYRVSSLVCLDTGSFNRFLRHLSTDVTQT